MSIDLLYPLSHFRSQLPSFELLEEEAIPEPYHALLVHRSSMTSKLEDLYRSAMTLRTLNSETEGNFHRREVLLCSADTGLPVEYGAIEIHLAAFDEPLRRLILEGQQPLGGLLKRHGVYFRSEPHAYFKLASDIPMEAHFGSAGVPLYGRCNVLVDDNDVTLARIVEVLRPIAAFPAHSHYDAIVIGAGPAGSTAGALLAEKGRRVLILERDKFPRYHIGESLMPFCWFTLNRLGVLEDIERIAYIKKHSVQFVSADGRQSQPFYFFKHYEHPSSVTWQVERADFDLMLLDNARRKGAEVLEETTVQRPLRDKNGRVIGVSAKTKDGKSFDVTAPVTIDCSGREQVTVAHEGWRVKDPQLNKLAIWTYFRGAKRDLGIDEGSTTVAYVSGRGWFWYIPLKNDIISVGIVAEKDYLFSESKDPAAILAREIQNNRWIAEHLEQGEQFGEFRVTSEYSYRSKFCAADGLVLAGDAFAFLDPVFSSGVFLALKSGEMAADAVDAALTSGDASGAQFADYGEKLCHGIENMRKLVYAFYDPNFSFGKMLKAHPEQRGHLTDSLIGNLFELDFTELHAAMRDFLELPAPIMHGHTAATAAVAV